MMNMRNIRMRRISMWVRSKKLVDEWVAPYVDVALREGRGKRLATLPSIKSQYGMPELGNKLFGGDIGGVADIALHHGAGVVGPVNFVGLGQ